MGKDTASVWYAGSELMPDITGIYHFGKSTTPDQLDQTWANCLNLFDAEYTV